MNLLAAIYVVLYGGVLGFGLGYLWRATEAVPLHAPVSVTAAAGGGSDQGDNDDGSPCAGAACPGGQPIPPP